MPTFQNPNAIADFTHVTINNGPGALVVRVHNTNPMLDYWVARDHGSDQFEISVSIADVLGGQKAVRLDMKNPRELSTTTIDDRNWRPATSDDYSQVTYAINRYAVMRSLLRQAICD